MSRDRRPFRQQPSENGEPERVTRASPTPFIGEEFDKAFLAPIEKSSAGQRRIHSGGGSSSKKAISPGAPPKRRRSSGSGFDRKSGRRPLKEYPLTKGEMETLAGIGILATLCFSGAAACFGFWVNVSMSIAMSGQLSSAVKAVWDTYKDIAFYTCPILLLMGCGFLYLGSTRIRKIEKETVHD